MLEISTLNVRSFDLDHLDLFWEIPTLPFGRSGDVKTHQIFDYTFTILRSEAAMGPYDIISVPLRDTYNFRDNKVSQRNKLRQWFYKIRVTHVPTGEVKEFGPASDTDPEPDLIASDIISQEDTLFREVIGRRCWLFPVRTFGPQCTCFDHVLQRKTTGRHLPCFGTGWLGGYMSPVEVFVQVDPNMKQSQISTLQEMQPGNTTARMTSFPPVKPRDILVESENRRWRVVTVATTQRLRAVLHQELMLHEIPRGDIEYELPVNVDAQTLQAAAERNFRNPQNLEDDEDLSTLTSAYGIPRGSLR